MTREEILKLSASEIEARKAELAKECESATTERLAEIGVELDAIEERAKALNIKARAAAAVAGGAGHPIGNPAPKVEKKTLKEVRDSQEYIEAFAKYVRTGKDMECRALVTENIDTGDHSGPVPVPTFIEERIRQAWERDEIWSRIRKTFVPGNLKVGFEISATDAVWHDEGSYEPAEEKLVLGIVDMVPKNIKKWITISDEVLALSAYDMLAFLYDEITYKNIKFAAAQAMARITAAPATSVPGGGVAVPVYNIAGTEPTAAELINAKALLGGEASDIVVICSRETEAALKAAALSAGYPYDPFDGSQVLHYEFPVATDVKMVIGDLNGILANLPEGDAVTFKFDDLSLSQLDLVKIVGRMMAAIEVVGPKMFVKLQTGE